MGPETAWVSNAYPLLVVGLVSMVCLSLGATLMYVVNSRRYKLNWFERNRLDSLACEEATIVKLCNRKRYHSGSTCSGGSLTDLTAVAALSRSTSLQKLSDTGSIGAATKSRGVDAQSLRSAASSVSVATTATTIENLNATVEVGGETSLCSDVSLQKYVQPSGSTLQRPKVTTMYEKIDHTKFNADMYRVEDTMSLVGDDGAETLSQIHLSCTYNAHYSVLCIRVGHASSLTSKSAITNPYVRMRLLPESGPHTQAKVGQVQMNTLEPQFEEDFIFNGISIADLKTKVVEILVLNQMTEQTDRISVTSASDDCLGGVHWSLDQMVDPVREHNVKNVTLVLPLSSPSEITKNMPTHGELQISMSYLQSAERLTVSVLRARGLSVVNQEHKKAGDAPDAFVRLTVVSTSGKSGKLIKKKKKTNVQKNTKSPIFNEAFTFNINREALRTASLHAVVCHEVPPSIPLQQKELILAKLDVPAGILCDYVHAATNGLQAKWFHLEAPEQAT